jgi:hypothetical protein
MQNVLIAKQVSRLCDLMVQRKRDVSIAKRVTAKHIIKIDQNAMMFFFVC